MKKFLLLLLIFISLDSFAQIQVKEGSFHKINGYVMLDKEDHVDVNNAPMALIKISTENITAEQRRKFTFNGNLATFFDVYFEPGEIHLYISAAAATFIEIIHDDYGKTEYWFPENLCDYCGYELVIERTMVESDFGFLAISSEPEGANIYIDGELQKKKTNTVIVNLSHGEHTLKLEKEGYSSLLRDFVITKGETLELDVKLMKQQTSDTNSNKPADNNISPVREVKYVVSGSINGHDYVDLGLPSGLKWATCNVGANKPEGNGNYYAWGETKSKSEYRTYNSVTYGKKKFNKKVIEANSKYDAARSNWGGSWRLPTGDEFQELLDKCTWEWTVKDGKKGYNIIGPNGNVIFLPAAQNSIGDFGSYWTSTIDEKDNDGAYDFFFGSNGRYLRWMFRYFGQSIRPVSE